MKNLSSTLICLLLLTITVEARVPKATRIGKKTVKAEYVYPSEGNAIEYSVSQLPRPSTIHYPSSRDVEITATLVDSSRNGYGMLLGATNPLHWEPSHGFTWCYRQWYIANESVSGQLGASFSSNGVEGTWDIYSGLNLSSPGETLARYPSAVGGSDYPYLVWNEYTTGSGGGDMGGRPLYTWDQFYYGGGSYFSPPLDINNGCQSTPCDPADNWVACPVITNDASGTPVLNVTYSGWSGSSSNSLASVRYIYRSNFHQAGYFAFNDAVELYTGEEFEAETGTGSYTSSAIIDINEDGVGYSAVISYFDGVVTEGEIPADTAHTFMLRKTEDNGATWSETGHNGTPFYYIPSEWLNTYFDDNDLFPEYYVASDTDSTEITEAYIPYDFELKVDSDGTLHIFAPVIPSGGGFIYFIEGCGMYHMWNDDPVNDPMGWEASYMGPMDITYMYGYASSNYFRIFPSSAISIENSDIMYCTWEAYSDTSEYAFNFDVFAVRSEDGGATWTEPMNITNTLMLDVDEIHPHLAPRATDEECYIVYMAPDYEVETVTPAASPEDYKQRLWFSKVTFEGEDVVMAPVTDFSAYPTEGYTPLEVTFTDLSIAGDTNVVSWYWDFGDGGTSSVQNPFHTYYVPGDYSVSLTATDANGLSDTETKVNYIHVWETSTQLSGNIGGMTLTPDEEWFVLDSVWVEDGDSLTILPGTVIKFTPGIDAYLLIKRGGYIHAQGTEDDPILFTSAADDPKSDDWLAFQILGKGPGQDPFWEVQEDHNAGILQYINIEYSSYGFGLINIGSGTQIDHISKAYSVTGFYILGGNVDLSYIAANGIRATALYCDGGYTGNIDELYINGAYRGIDIDNVHGAYWDYDEQLNPDAEPRTNPTISHLTLTNIQTVTLYFRYGGVGTVSDVIIYDYSWNWGGLRCTDEYLLNEISIDNIQHYDWHQHNLTNGSNAEQVVTNIVEEDPIFEGFVPTNSDGRGAMTDGDWLSSWGSYIPINEIAHVYLNWIGTVMPGDTIETKLCFGLSEGNLLSSADVDIYYNPYLFEVLNVERNPDFFPDNEISVIYNVVNDTIHLSLASDGDLDTDEAWEAVLLQFEVINTYQDTVVYDIDPVSILVNENAELFTDFYRGAGVRFLILQLGDVSQNGEISSYDAALILQYLVGNTDLDAAQLWNADVSGYEGVSAYDASLIQQYMVGLIDIFPADTGAYAAPAEGFITMEDQTILSGQPVEVQLILTDGDNILSFEESVVYNPDHLTFIEVEWSDVLNDFLIESNDQDGELQFAGSGSLPDGQEGLFATFHFVVNEDFEEDETVVTLQRLRWNEEEAMENSAWATLTNQLAIGNEAIPIEYRLAQNYPNPFNPVTLIKYDLPEQSHVNIVIYDMLGRQVRTLVNIIQEAGFKSVLWNATNDYGKPVSAGVYLYQIHAGEFVQTKKMVLLK